MRPLKLSKETWKVVDQLVFHEMPEAQEELFSLKQLLSESIQDAELKGKKMGEKEGEKKGALRNQQRILIRQLYRKFPEPPQSVVQRIETTDEMDLLDQWLDELMVANSLTETALATS